MSSKMTREEVLYNLRDVNYIEARDYYTKKKKQFEKQFRQNLSGSQEYLYKNYLNEFINGINNQGLQRESFNLVNDLIKSLNTALEDSINDNNRLSSFDYYTENSETKRKQLTEKGRKVLEDELFQYLDFDKLQKMIFDNFSKFGMNEDGGVNPSDILSWSKSYLTTTYFNQIQKQSNNPNRAQLAGYFEEALVHKVMGELSKHLKRKIGTLHTASIKINYNGKNIDTIFDGYINFLSNNDLSKTFKESINIEEGTLKKGFGYQVKLYNGPWGVQNPRNRYAIANNAQLLNLWKNKRGWIEGIHYLEPNATKVFGDNVMYILGNNFYWTADMISLFRKKNYFLAFHYNEQNKPTNSIGWETIDMSKPN